MKNKMEKRTIDGGYIKCNDFGELRKLFLLEDETMVLGLCYEEYADVFYYTPAFKEITKAIEDSYANAAGCKCGTYKLDDNYTIILEALPTQKGCERSLAMTLVNKDNKEVYKLVKYMSAPKEADAQDSAHKFMEGMMTSWITNMSHDITHSSLFWLYDQDYEAMLEMVAQV